MADDIPSRVAVLERIAQSIDSRLDRIETRLDRIEARQADDFRFLVRMQITLTSVTIGLMLAGFATLGGLILHGFHWI